MAKAIVDRFGSRPCFAGLYISYEIDFRDFEVELYERLVRKHLRPAIGKVKILASPGNLGVEMPGRQLDELPKLVERTNIDILAPQDYGGPRLQRRARPSPWSASRSRPLRRCASRWPISAWRFGQLRGVRFRGDPGRETATASPGRWNGSGGRSRCRRRWSKSSSAYQYQGIMNRHTELVNIGHPGTEKLYQDYTAYIKKRFG